MGIELLPTGLAGDPTMGVDAGAADSGTCVMKCENPHGTSSCVAGACVHVCEPGYADCDGDPTNGCEASTRHGAASCGSCEVACANPHGEALCSEGLCTPACDRGFGDCDDDAANGCEASLQTALACGSCGTRCTNAHGMTGCVEGSCSPTCAAGFASCDGDPNNGCEANLESDPRHCGDCGRTCASSQICVDGACQASPCAAGRGECDDDPATVCETSLDRATEHCGFCGNTCVPAEGSGGIGACNAGACGTRCDLSGSFALKLQVSVTWPQGDAIRSGSGTYALWFKLQGTHAGNAVATTVIPCGRRVPPFAATLVNETYFYDYPATLFDEAPPRVPNATATATLSGSALGASYSLPFVALVMGTNLADPLNGVWPTRASGLSRVDADGDGKPGVTALYGNGGGFTHPRTGTTLFSERASRPYAAARTVFSLQGRFDTCTRSTGQANVRFVDTRIFGCRMADGSRDCTAAEADFLDRNCPDYRFGNATYTLARVAAGATCADVQATLP